MDKIAPGLGRSRGGGGARPAPLAAVSETGVRVVLARPRDPPTRALALLLRLGIERVRQPRLGAEVVAQARLQRAHVAPWPRCRASASAGVERAAAATRGFIERERGHGGMAAGAGGPAKVILATATRPWTHFAQPGRGRSPAQCNDRHRLLGRERLLADRRGRRARCARSAGDVRVHVSRLWSVLGADEPNPLTYERASLVVDATRESELTDSESPTEVSEAECFTLRRRRAVGSASKESRPRVRRTLFPLFVDADTEGAANELTRDSSSSIIEVDSLTTPCSRLSVAPASSFSLYSPYSSSFALTVGDARRARRGPASLKSNAARRLIALQAKNHYPGASHMASQAALAFPLK